MHWSYCSLALNHRYREFCKLSTIESIRSRHVPCWFLTSSLGEWGCMYRSRRTHLWNRTTETWDHNEDWYLCLDQPSSHIEAGAKWSPFGRQHFQTKVYLENILIIVSQLKFHWSFFLLVVDLLVVQFIKVSLKFHVIVWCRTGTKPLPEPMMTQYVYT